jgi:hypothetical protein
VSKSGDLRAKAQHYRELASMLDDDTAAICRDLAARYDREAAEGDAAEPLPDPMPPDPA